MSLQLPRRARINWPGDKPGWLILMPSGAAFAFQDEYTMPVLFYPWDAETFPGVIVEWFDESGEDPNGA